MKLKLQENKVNQLLLTEASGETLASDFSLGFEPVFSEDDPSEFRIVFDFEYITKDDKYLRVDFHSIFKTDSEIDQGFKDSKFPIVNAPAIAFPFLRAFVANLLISGGHQPILLPSINFSNFKKEEISPPQNPD
ncbi:protein-export chaperone SecB [Serratia nematodiphila]